MKVLFLLSNYESLIAFMHLIRLVQDKQSAGVEMITTIIFERSNDNAKKKFYDSVVTKLDVDVVFTSTAFEPLINDGP